MKFPLIALLVLSAGCRSSSNSSDDPSTPVQTTPSPQNTGTPQETEENFQATGDLLALQPAQPQDTKTFHGYCSAQLRSLTFTVYGDAATTGEIQGAARYSGNILSLSAKDTELYRCETEKNFAAPFPPVFFESLGTTYFNTSSSYLRCKAMVRGICPEFVAGEKCSFDPSCSSPGSNGNESQP